jgi:Mg2+/Co2+ transporter CorB
MTSEEIVNQYKSKLKFQQGGTWQQQQERVRQEKLANLRKINPNIV